MAPDRDRDTSGWRGQCAARRLSDAGPRTALGTGGALDGRWLWHHRDWHGIAAAGPRPRAAAGTAPGTAGFE